MATAEETYLTDYATYTGVVASLEANGFKKSSTVTAHAATVVGADSYCLSVASQSGDNWYYGSAVGAPSKTAC